METLIILRTHYATIYWISPETVLLKNADLNKLVLHLNIRVIYNHLLIYISDK